VVAGAEFAAGAAAFFDQVAAAVVAEVAVAVKAQAVAAAVAVVIGCCRRVFTALYWQDVAGGIEVEMFAG